MEGGRGGIQGKEGSGLCRSDPGFFCPYLSAAVPGELFGFCGPLAVCWSFMLGGNEEANAVHRAPGQPPCCTDPPTQSLSLGTFTSSTVRFPQHVVTFLVKWSLSAGLSVSVSVCVCHVTHVAQFSDCSPFRVGP